MPGLSYYVIILGRSSRGSEGGQVARTSHAPSSSSSSDPCPPQGRSRRIYDLTVLRRVGETVLRKVDTRKFPSCLVFMYEKYPARMDDDEAAVTSCAFEFLAAAFCILKCYCAKRLSQISTASYSKYEGDSPPQN